MDLHSAPPQWRRIGANGALFAQSGGANVNGSKDQGIANSGLMHRRSRRSNCYGAPADAVRDAPCFGPSTTTSAPVFTRLYRSITASFVNRMHPDEIACPSDPSGLGSAVDAI